MLMKGLGVAMSKRHKAMKNLITGMSGGALLMVSDWLVGTLKSDNVSNGVVQSSWPQMAFWRFEAAMLIASVAVVMLFFGARTMIQIVKQTLDRRDPWSMRVIQTFEIGSVVIVVAELFIHMKECMLPIIYKSLYDTALMGADMLTVVEDSFFYMAIPYYVFTIMMILCTSIPMIYQIWRGRLRLPRFFMALNPLGLWILGWIIRLFKVNVLSNFTRAFLSLGIVFLFYGVLQHVMRLPSREEE